MRTQRRRVRRRQDAVFLAIDSGTLLLRMRTPQKKNQGTISAGQERHHPVCESLPAFLLMRRWLIPLDREHAVEEQYPSFGPGAQVTVARNLEADIGGELLIDVLQRRRDLHATVHRKAETVRLPRVVVRVLPKNHDANLAGRHGLQGRKDL